MRQFWIGLAMAVGASAAAAQEAPPPAPMSASILTWSPEQQRVGYRTIETIYPTRVFKAGGKVHPLPKAARTIDPSFEVDGKRYTLASWMAETRVSGVLVLKDGQIVLERYALGRTAEDRWTSFSVAKSLTSTLVGAAIADGKIASLDAAVTDYIPQLKGSAYDGVTVAQLLTMTSGVKWNEDYTDPKSDVAQAGFVGVEPGVNPIVSYMRRLPREAAPGTKFVYKTGETDLAGILVSQAVGKTLADYTAEKIWIPYGMERDGIWMLDSAGHERGGCCISVTLRDYARIGQFLLDGGAADGKPVVPAGWSRDATAVHVDHGGGPGSGYGYFWWINPTGAYEAGGIFGQSISTFRDDRVIVVINSAWPRATDDAMYRLRDAFTLAAREAANAP